MRRNGLTKHDAPLRIQYETGYEAFKRGDYVNGTIDTIQVGLGFIPPLNLLNIPIDILQFAFS